MISCPVLRKLLSSGFPGFLRLIQTDFLTSVLRIARAQGTTGLMVTRLKTNDRGVASLRP